MAAVSPLVAVALAIAAAPPAEPRNLNPAPPPSVPDPLAHLTPEQRRARVTAQLRAALPPLFAWGECRDVPSILAPMAAALIEDRGRLLQRIARVPELGPMLANARASGSSRGPARTAGCVAPSRNLAPGQFRARQEGLRQQQRELYAAGLAFANYRNLFGV